MYGKRSLNKLVSANISEKLFHKENRECTCVISIEPDCYMVHIICFCTCYDTHSHLLVPDIDISKLICEMERNEMYEFI